MGVLACSRYGCENIMCDRYSPKYGYICNECFEELIESGDSTNIKEFMDSKKEEYSNKEAARARYNIVFPYNEG